MMLKLVENTDDLTVTNDDDLYCSKCHTKAACKCNARKVTGLMLAKKAIAADPNRTDAVIADELGIHVRTVNKARQFGPEVQTDTRTGRDGKKYPAKRKRKAKKQQASASDPIQEPCYDCADDAERWQRSLSSLAGDAISMAAFWDREFGKQWRKFAVPSDLLTLAKQAARAWMTINNNLAKRKRR